jgi:hypothetical protein
VSHEASLAQVVAVNQLGDGGGLMSNKILELFEVCTMQHRTYGYLSLNAIIGTQNNKVIHLRDLVNNQVLSILIDSGNSHSFLNASMLDRSDCVVTLAICMKATMANG